MCIFKNLKDNHGVHGLGLGVMIYLMTKKPGLAIIVGGGAYAYMRKFGHRTGVTAEELKKILE